MTCYCCGEPIGDRVALVTLRARDESINMVFLMKPEHVELVDQDKQSEELRRGAHERRTN